MYIANRPIASKVTNCAGRLLLFCRAAVVVLLLVVWQTHVIMICSVLLLSCYVLLQLFIKSPCCLFAEVNATMMFCCEAPKLSCGLQN